MKGAIVLAVLVAAAYAAPVEQNVAVSQDTLGNYKLDLNIEDIARSEHRTADGSLSGFYSYVGKDGLLRKIDYTSGVQGFQASGDSIPVAPIPVQDTPEVSEARAKHLTILNEEFARAARERALTGEPAYVEPEPLAPVFIQQAVAAPSGVLETPDVRAARELHFAAVEAALQQHRNSFN